MKTRLVSLSYRGSASVDPRYSAAMLPWTINDIRSTDSHTKLSVGIENGILEAYNSDFELQYSHPLKHIVGMCRIRHKQNGKIVGNGFLQLKQLGSSTTSYNANGLQKSVNSLTTSTSYGSLSASAAAAYNNANAAADVTNAPDPAAEANNFMEFTGPLTGLVYLMKNPRDPLLHIFLYECEAVEEMAELMSQMRNPAHTLGGSVGSIPQTLIANNSNNGSSAELSMQKALTSYGNQSTPASNLKLSESVRNAPHDPSPNLVSSKMKSSQSYTHGLSNSAGTVHIPTSTSAQSNLALLTDISPNHTHFFEVLYVGKIRVSHKRVPYSFIDDALPKFKAYDAQRSRQMQSTSNRKMSLNSETGVESKSSAHSEHEDVQEEDEDAAAAEEELEQQRKEKSAAENLVETKTTTTAESASSADETTTETSAKDTKKVNVTETTPTEANKENKSPARRLLRGMSQMEIIVKKDIPKQRDRSASYGCIPPYVEQNRTMVFLVGRSDLRLISPDRKQVLLYKDFKDVASCAQGQKSADHFGIICREAQSDGYIGYVFKCQSDHVCDDIVSAISQAFVTCAEQKRKEATQIFSCEHCPMLWYHKLCNDVEGLSEKKTQAMIFRRIESLTEDEQDTIRAKFYGSEKMSAPLTEQNQFLMMLLRAHCESRQQRHVHDTAENRSEFLNQYLGGSTIFMKAKRSLTNSFDHLLKRRASKDEIIVPHHLRADHQHQPIRESSVEQQLSGGNKSGNDTPPDEYRSRSNTAGASPSNKPTAEQLKSPMMDIFMKVGNSPKEAETHQGSWRQAILNSVVTPSKGMENDSQVEFLSPMRIIKPKHGKRTRADLRELWKTAIRQTILLNRMETENAMLQIRQNENELKRIKLDYEEIVVCDKQLVERWEMIIERDAFKLGNKKDPKVLAQAIKGGVPRSKRGDVWMFLADQHSMYTAPVDTKRFPNFNTPYHTLLKNLTEHQHAIFIDLGRTFPNHRFYKDPLGVGQLSLFNLLKAYSILDPELGYCQGLGFICGILLLHCDEADAFLLLKHLMFRRQMRTKYLPDMKMFQLQLYQLSRLVKDYLPELYAWLDQNDVSPTLYAAPWILTVFSSQFPLGFVARVFDLLFLESSEVIFKFAIALLSVHKEAILARDNFEEIMDYLKTCVPKIDETSLEKIMKLSFMLDIGKQLNEYNVEYNVLQEEITTTNHHLEMLKCEKARNQHLEQQLQFAQSSIAQMEKTRSSQQTQISLLQTQVQSLEMTIQTLGRFVGQLAECNIELELSPDVRRILQQLEDIERQRRKPHFAERKIGKSVSVNSHLGFPLKVLEELNEKDEHGSQQKQKKEKTPFFEHTYEQQQKQRQQHQQLLQQELQQQKQQQQQEANTHTSNGHHAPQIRPNRLLNSPTTSPTAPTKLHELRLPDHVDKFVSSIKSPIEVDSGVGTPLSPPSTSSNNSSSSSSSSSGSLFSRMGYKNTPAALVPRQYYNINATVPTPTTLPTSTSLESNIMAVPNEKPTTTAPPVVELKSPPSPEPMHPLSMVGGDVHVRFNGTTQLKTKGPMHYMRPVALDSGNAGTTSKVKESLPAVDGTTGQS